MYFVLFSVREGQNKLIDVFAYLIHGENDSHIAWSYPENCLNEVSTGCHT